MRNTTRYSGNLKGFGGWLLLLAIGIWLSPFRSLLTLSEVTQGVKPEVLSRIQIVFNGEMALIGVLVIMQGITIVFMMQRSWRFVPMFIAMGAYAVLLPLVDLAWSSTVMSALSGQPVGYLANLMAPEAIGHCIGAMIFVVIWSLYLTRSSRVANTFIRHIAPVAPAQPA